MREIEFRGKSGHKHSCIIKIADAHTANKEGDNVED